METLYFGKTYDEIFERSWKKFVSNKEDHTFRHYNNSLGMMIYSKEQLKQEMKKRRILPLDVCEGLADEWDGKMERYNQNRIKTSDKALHIIRNLKFLADRNGNLQLGGRAIAALKEIGAVNQQTDFKGITGGWN